MRSVRPYASTWLVVVAAALLLVVFAPRVSHVVGRLPGVVGQQLESNPVVRSRTGEPILALVTFRRDHRRDVESWIDGLKLGQDLSIAWIRMPVVNDVGDPQRRSEIEGRLLARYASAQERANLLPVFTDREAFVRATGVGDTSQAYVLVIDRGGQVLAHVAGAFDEDKARIVLASLALPGL